MSEDLPTDAAAQPSPDSSSRRRVVAEGSFWLYHKPMCDARMEVPRELPGIVIFIHGVNDPGAAYETVETGLCQGLNERLNRGDLKPGEYGVLYQGKRKAALPPDDIDYKKDQAILHDADTYLYARTLATDTNSVFVPFTWGYRASDDDIAKDAKDNDPLMVRGQYQDVHGNRLDAHFAKQGGFFSNATTTLAEMYGAGFESGLFTKAGERIGMDDYQHAPDGPSRRYFVLAAERLAMLIQEMRAAHPSDRDAAAHETITVIGHSQGAMIALLAQALLAERKVRGADTLILANPPYSLYEPTLERLLETGAQQITTQARVKTLLNIVAQTHQDQHATPPLEELDCNIEGNADHGGRASWWWSPQAGRRLGPDGQEVVFAERDNRGKVYLYFCPQDTTTDFSMIQAIGARGVPDTVPEPRVNDHHRSRPLPLKPAIPVMAPLVEVGFRQRMWSRELREGKPILVGAATETTLVEKQAVRINGEALNPPHPPQLYGGEEIVGDAEHAGRDRPDAVGIDTALGNPQANDRSVHWKTITSLQPPDLQALKEQFNARAIADDQTEWVFARRVKHDRKTMESTFEIERAETPNETRRWREQNEAALSTNSYHSAILRSTENHRWVTAMDVAIGQAVTLDEPEWRELWIAIGDWRMPSKSDTKKGISTGIEELKHYPLLSEAARQLIEANIDYYWSGIEPPAHLVSQAPPPLVNTQTRAERYQQVTGDIHGHGPGAPWSLS